ncbi:MAG: heavy metal translocating P-type ATPase [Pseudomonadota bacterium]
MPLDQSAPRETVDLLIPGMSCAGCMIRIERCLSSAPGIAKARANLSAHTAHCVFDPSLTNPDALIEVLSKNGFAARLFDLNEGGKAPADSKGQDLLLRLGVAGFAAMNVMILSISVWSGAEASTRDLLHWISGLIALPAVAFAGKPFFQGALTALSAGRMNMDVPISLAVILAAGNSVLETARGGPDAYFDAAIMLIFFLLIGRYLEHRTRSHARSAAVELMGMAGRTTLRVLPDGKRLPIKVEELSPSMIVEVAPGERIPVDGRICLGSTEIDRALVTGESAPEWAALDSQVYAGMLNLTGSIHVEVIATGDETMLAEIAQMVDAAERGKGRLDRIADQVARIYAPLVHILAASAFLYWLPAQGGAHGALQIAVAVLIVTCPCALALAVPTVHTVASARLFKEGIFLKNGADLERLAQVDMVVFDKTGTLTEAESQLCSPPRRDDPAWPVAAALATASHHPLSRAIAREAKTMGIQPARVTDIIETPGFGVEGKLNGHHVRLGRHGWAGADEPSASGVALSMHGHVIRFQFTEALRQDAAETCAELSVRGLDLAILSGDRTDAVAKIAKATGISEARAAMLPGDKLAWLKARIAEGRRILMVGDGLNDSPALALAHCSMSPASASDVAKTAAGLVFTSDSLAVVARAHLIACRARRRMLECFGIAAAYNAVAIPLAVSGFVTPLIAAIAMSASSILVVVNALRLRGSR